MEIAGVLELKDSLEYLKLNAGAYRKGGVPVPHFFLNLKKGNGQSVVAKYITDYLKTNKLRTFHGIDSLLEYVFDGTLKQEQSIFSDIRSNAVFTNDFEGVIAFDITAFSEHLNEYQVDIFMEEVERIAKSATLIIYYDDCRGKRIEAIKEKIMPLIGSSIAIDLSPYSEDEYVEIMICEIRDRGFIIDDEKTFKDTLREIIKGYTITDAKQAVSIVDDIVVHADYGGYVHRISTDLISKKAKYINKFI